ncbi:MAG: hypothetical protein HFJ84_05880 [Clostridiales bacterium]|jgi:hypothetical protein|nr:hypothetical protein [Clostridiales bacterium]
MKKNMKAAVLFTEDIYDETIEHSRIDWEKIRNCSFKEKETLLPFIQKLKFCENFFFPDPLSLYFQSPLLILKSLFDTFQEDEYERMAALLIIESVNPQAICSILYNYISSSHLSNIKYLEYTLFNLFFLEVVIHGKKVLDQLLLSYLGTEFIQNNRDFFSQESNS